MKTIMLLGTTAALALPALGGASAQDAASAQCVPAFTEGGFALTIRVDGEDGLFRLTCRDGVLVAVPTDAVVGNAVPTMTEEPAEAEAKEIDPSGERDLSELGTSEALAEPPAELTPPDGDTAEMMADEVTAPQPSSDEGTAADGADTSGENGDAAQDDALGTATETEADGTPSQAGSTENDASAADSASAAINDLVGDTGDNAALMAPPAELAEAEGEADGSDVAEDGSVEAMNPADVPAETDAATAEDDAAADAGTDPSSVDTASDATEDGDEAGEESTMAADMASDAAEDDAQDADAAETIAESADAAASELETDALDTPPEDLTDLDTARNAAGVSGAKPETSVTEAPQDDDPSGPAAMADENGMAADKPAVAPQDAAPDGEAASPGKAKQDDRLAATDAPEADEADESTEPDMVAVPLAVIGSAELALPGADFRSVAIQGTGADRIYALRGEMRSGRDVAVAVAEDGAIVKIDRQIRQDDVPERILRIAEALVPDAEIDRVTLSNRDNYKSFFVFSGIDSRGEPFELEVRSDGRSVAFDRPS